MDFIDHAVNWAKGEIFEGWMLALWGALLLVMSFFFWKFGQVANTRALIIPFLVIGLLWSIAGVVMVDRNEQRIPRYQQSYESDPAAFVEAERERVEGFIGWYRYLLLGWSVVILIGLALFTFWGGNYGRAIGLAVILFAVAGLLVDNTSEHNALTYQAEIKNALES